jgi:hypothetical protein
MSGQGSQPTSSRSSSRIPIQSILERVCRSRIGKSTGDRQCTATLTGSIVVEWTGHELSRRRWLSSVQTHSILGCVLEKWAIYESRLAPMVIMCQCVQQAVAWMLAGREVFEHLALVFRLMPSYQWIGPYRSKAIFLNMDTPEPD